MEYIKKIYGVNIEDLPGDSYLREIPFLKNFKGMEIDSPVTFFVGENGTGKERDGFFLRAESFYNLASEVDNLAGSGYPDFYDSYGGKSLHFQSHGESFRSLILNRFRGKGIYLLDEPESALSPTSIMSLLCIIHELEKEDSQFFIATHSPILLAYPHAKIFEFSERGIEEKTYKETESYSITKTFLDDPEKMIDLLFR